jgi:hypothetical protein
LLGDRLGDDGLEEMSFLFSQIDDHQKRLKDITKDFLEQSKDWLSIYDENYKFLMKDDEGKTYEATLSEILRGNNVLGLLSNLRNTEVKNEKTGEVTPASGFSFQTLVANKQAHVIGEIAQAKSRLANFAGRLQQLEEQNEALLGEQVGLERASNDIQKELDSDENVEMGMILEELDSYYDQARQLKE